jgi:N-acylneuraminate cytidylyltransferase
MKSLFIIPARGGSKGIPHKNIKELAGKPLINYSIDVARQITGDENICVSTEDDIIIECVEKTGLTVPFKRPAELASDTATTNDVLLHAIKYYHDKGIDYDNIVLLQPTSPLRTAEQVKEAMALYRDDIDMVVSVKENVSSVVLFKENDNGYLEHAFDVSKGLRRQDALKLYEYNGAIYVINCKSLINKGMSGLSKVVKYVMSEETSVDIDNMFDWRLSELMMVD